MLQRDVSANSAKTVKHFAFLFSDLKTSIDAPRREVTLHTVFGKNAKGLDRLSEVTPRWIIELSTANGVTESGNTPLVRN